MSSPPDFDGYDEPTRFEYPTVWIHVGSAILLVVALVSNAAGAITDLYALYRPAELPGGSILYSESVDTPWTYEPAGSEGSGVRDRRS